MRLICVVILLLLVGCGSKDEVINEIQPPRSGESLYDTGRAKQYQSMFCEVHKQKQKWLCIKETSLQIDEGVVAVANNKEICIESILQAGYLCIDKSKLTREYQTTKELGKVVREFCRKKSVYCRSITQEEAAQMRLIEIY